jgi:tRNA1(Val) A37 N6-methylase TrmN6
MRELVRTNNAVLITAIEALLKGADIPHAVLDQHMSVMEGSLGMLPRRIVVGDEHHDDARRLLEDAGLGHELRPVRGAESTDATEDAVLGGRLRLKQSKRGHRVGHDAILLAAATDARPDDHVVDLGAGVGGAGLALASRIPGARVTLVEIDPALTRLAAENIERNGPPVGVSAVTLDIRAPLEAFDAVGLGPGCADRVLMNPPFNDPARQTVSPELDRRAAHAAPQGTLETWISVAARLLHSAGALTLIWRADGLGDVLAALRPQFGGIAILPVHGRAGEAAIRVLVRAVKGGRAPLRLLPGLNLNDEAGRPTAAAEDVLRHAMPLDLAGTD